jgi:hypothetical protein
MRYKEVQTALREQILTAVNNTFLIDLEHEELGHIAKVIVKLPLPTT